MHKMKLFRQKVMSGSSVVVTYRNEENLSGPCCTYKDLPEIFAHIDEKFRNLDTFLIKRWGNWTSEKRCVCKTAARRDRQILSCYEV